MKPGHTPGPWRLDHSEPFHAEIVDANGRRVFGLKVWLDDACHDRNHEALANGTLAAAAPDLLAALKRLLEAGRGDIDTREGQAEGLAAEFDAEAAIAKAEGTS